MLTVSKLIDRALALSGQRELSNDSYYNYKYLNKPIHYILAGIDMGTPEILAANQIEFDCVFGHHPAGGSAIQNLHMDIMYQITKLNKLGIIDDYCIKYIKGLSCKIEYDYYGFNYYRTPSLAELLNINFLTIHTTIDILTEKFIEEVILKKLSTNSSIIDLINELKTVNEIKQSIEDPRIVRGIPENTIGIVVPIFTCSPDPNIFDLYFSRGIDTIIAMYVTSNFDVSKIPDDKNLVVLGHMAGDSIGMNILLSDLKRDYTFQIKRISGLLGGKYNEY